ncbi:hypothetical protein [Streptomyces sp. NPDC046712]
MIAQLTIVRQGFPLRSPLLRQPGEPGGPERQTPRWDTELGWFV